jgi:hypothetical protein
MFDVVSVFMMLRNSEYNYTVCQYTECCMVCVIILTVVIDRYLYVCVLALGNIAFA